MEIDAVTPIPVINGEHITQEEFEQKYLHPQIPVILRGLWKGFPAYSKWTYEFFKETMGDIEVGLYSSSQADPSQTLSVPTKKMKFSEYLKLIETEPTDLRLFLFPIFKHKPELLKDFDYPTITKKYIKLPFMFFGPKKSITRMHQDIDMSNVFLTQFEGKKRVVLFPPSQSRLLYRLPLNVHTTVDIDHPDFKTYPGLKYAKGMSGVLEYGDTLFMPAAYWHHIEYLEGGYGLSLRTLAPKFSMRVRGAYNLVIQRYVDDLMRKLFDKKWYAFKLRIAQNRANRDIKKIENHNHKENRMPAYH
ncbi:MAG: cupin-like domain-containing protein [Chitinophagales bacterium]